MHLTPPTLAAVIVSALALLTQLTPPVQAHSWVECADWRLKDPSNEAWGDKDGECKGYARRFPLKSKFGDLDHADPSRHYRQDKKDPDNALPCSDGEHGEEAGSDETRGNPIESAYGGKWGPMTHTRVGDKLCLRWPAKTHAENSEHDTMVLVNLAQREGADPTQKQLTKSLVKELHYNNCDKGKDEDKRTCGGCIDVPLRASGTYLLQWRWELNEGEWYTSCADIQIGESTKRRK
ncbi:MAG: hypothetical protein J3R72DRAFT_188084 [Linnemannia gamsii]|nr:MAG: hypothetical protein J3R72DRAFT_188084 [Linnemannia gamsii]